MRISDLIAEYILNELNNASGTASFSRTALADRFDCVPSQINYVLSTRFSPEHGYSIDSRRGGGGFIRITRIDMTRGQLLMHIINTVGAEIDSATAAAFLSNMCANGVIDNKEAVLIQAAVSDHALAPVEKENRDAARATVLKQCLLVLK